VQKAVCHDGPFCESLSATKRIGFIKKTNQYAVKLYSGHGENRIELETDVYRCTVHFVESFTLFFNR